MSRFGCVSRLGSPRWALGAALLVGIAIAIAGCASARPASDPAPVVVATIEPREREPGEPAPRASTAILVGAVGRRGVRVCSPSDRSSERWLGVGFVAGATPLAGELGELDQWRGQPVLFEGAALEAAPPSPEVDPGADGPEHCPIAQMRSDWIETPDGVAIRRAGVDRFPAFRVERARPFDGIRVHLEGEELEITLANTLEKPIANPTLRLQYEGCYGKPGSDLREQSFEALAPGAHVRARFPATVEREGSRGQVHAASSIEVVSASPEVRFDFDVALHRFDVRVECPR